MQSFDKYPTIDYIDTTHLYWNLYAVKVVTLNEDGETFDSRRYSGWPYDQIDRLRRRARYLKKLCKHVPADAGLWKVHYCGTFNFFFVNTADANLFIDNHPNRVVAVYRPASRQHQALMAADHKVLVRNSLFWGRYRWRVTLRSLAREDQEDMREWFESYFGEEQNPDDECGFPSRAYYSTGATHRVYFSDERDVILTKLGNHQFIQRIERVVLKSEVENFDNGIGTGTEAG